MRSLIAVSSLALIAACATNVPEASRPATTADTPPAERAVVPGAYELAMTTVDQLVAAENEQQAIDRIKQLLGNPELTDPEKASALMRLGELRYGEGNDVFGAIDAWDELIEDFPESEQAIAAGPLRDIARGEGTSLNFALENGTLSPTEAFEYTFRLGNHQDAADMMLARNLTPDNAYLVDMFQIGYLCEDTDLTGPSYNMTEPDGTARVVQFCEFGK